MLVIQPSPPSGPAQRAVVAERLLPVDLDTAVHYLPPLLSLLPDDPESPPTRSGAREVKWTTSRLPAIDAPSRRLHDALHGFQPIDASYARVSYASAFNWGDLDLPVDLAHEWCVARGMAMLTRQVRRGLPISTQRARQLATALRRRSRCARGGRPRRRADHVRRRRRDGALTRQVLVRIARCRRAQSRNLHLAKPRARDRRQRRPGTRRRHAPRRQHVRDLQARALSPRQAQGRDGHRCRGFRRAASLSPRSPRCPDRPVSIANTCIASLTDIAAAAHLRDATRLTRLALGRSVLLVDRSRAELWAC